MASRSKPPKLAAAIFDLDRTLLAGSSAPIYAKHLAAAGMSTLPEKGLAGTVANAVSGVLSTVYNAVGENPLMMAPAHFAHRATKGWSVANVETAAIAASAEVASMLAPFAQNVFDQHRDAGRQLVLATTSPLPFVAPLAELLGFDAVIATKWKHGDGEYLGELDSPFLWGPAKAKAVESWATESGVALEQSWAYSDSYYDTPLLASVGHPVAVNPDPQLAAAAVLNRWPIRHLDKNEGVAKIAGRELQEWGRPFMRKELVAPYADLTFGGIENIPAEGPCIVVFNHRSYFDPTVMALLLAQAGRNIRGLGKKEVFDVPLIGSLLRSFGGVRVERASGSDEPLKQAAAALAGGELVMMAPQGTIPRGPAFFEPELKGRWGAARLAALSKAPVIPVGLWGTELVWPRSARMPKLGVIRPAVTAEVGTPVDLKYRSPDADTERIMTAISALLPEASRERREPTEADLAATYPPGYRGDPAGEAGRRPGTDTKVEAR